ncbi:MAG: hypothetical protein RLZ97_650, partial [Verrucomicrobiota bacterium]
MGVHEESHGSRISPRAGLSSRVILPILVIEVTERP